MCVSSAIFHPLFDLVQDFDLWGAEMRSAMKHAYKCGAIRRVLVLRRRFVAFPEERLQFAPKCKALAGQWNDADDDD